MPGSVPPDEPVVPGRRALPGDGRIMPEATPEPVTPEPVAPEPVASEPVIPEPRTSADSADAGRDGTSGTTTSAGAPPSRRRRGVLAGLAALLACLVALGVWAHQRHGAPGSSSSPTPSSTPFTLRLPATLSTDYSLVAPSPTPEPNADGSTGVTGTYQHDGRRAVVVMLSRPATDPESFLSIAGFGSQTHQGPDVWCGLGVDPNAMPASPASTVAAPSPSDDPSSSTPSDPGAAPYRACVLVRDQTAIITVGVLQQDADELAALDRQFAAQIAHP